ncbi:MAG: hypothetical protein ACRC1T_05165 [Clostridium chrysemydis]|uniref:hypothetical protein n=1 Tax=Clostridium chrysemydis TaxID=2665504 RepID=UPI003F3FD0ED
MNTIRIIQEPVDIRIDCPYCDCEIEMLYNDFEELMLISYPGDWIGERIICPDCEKEIKIESLEWD